MHEIKLHIPIEKAVIYPQSAGITRGGPLAFQPGENRVVIINLPEFLTEDSVRIELAAGTRLKILEVFTEDRLLPGYDENIFRQTKAQWNELLQQSRRLEAKFRNYTEEFLLFFNKEKISAAAGNEVHRPLHADNWQAFLDFLEQKLQENRQQAREVLFDWLAIQRELQAAKANLRKYSSYDQIREHRIITVIESPAELREELKLYYLQEGISWHPAYRIRANIDENQLSITLFAMVTQQTGEDWQDIGIELATAIPMINCRIPSLQAKLIQEQSAEVIMAEPALQTKGLVSDLELDLDEEKSIAKADLKERAVQRPSAKKMKSADSRSRTAGRMGGGAEPMKVSDEAFRAVETGDKAVLASTSPMHSEKGALAWVQALQELVTQAEANLKSGLSLPALGAAWQELFHYLCLEYDPASRVPAAGDFRTNKHFVNGISPLESLGGYDYRYRVSSRKNFIPSGGTPVQLGVEIKELPMQLAYVTIPYNQEAVFLKAVFSNQGLNPFPGGPAQVFVENNFLGNIAFPTLGRHKGTSLSLGIEKDLKVKRSETSLRRTTGMLSKAVLVDYTIGIELASYKQQPVEITVYDRLPVSKLPKEITLLEETFEPQPSKITEEKILIWQVTLEPGRKQQIKFKYTLKQPENFRLELSEGSYQYTE